LLLILKSDDINFLSYICTDLKIIQKIIETEKLDIILMDILLGESNGLTIASKLLAIQP